MGQSELPANGRGWQTTRGRLAIWLPGRGLLIGQLEGHGEDEFSWPIVQAFDDVLASGQPAKMFFDLGKLRNYDTLLRTRLTARFLRDRRGVAALEILIQSRFVAMGVAVANLALGGLVKPHAKRTHFNLALDAALKGAGIVGFSSSTLTAA